MDYRLFSAKSLSEPVMACFNLKLWGQISLKVEFMYIKHTTAHAEGKDSWCMVSVYNMAAFAESGEYDVWWHQLCTAN